MSFVEIDPLMQSATNDQTLQPLLDPREAGAYLQLCDKTVTRMARQKLLPAIRLGKHWRFRAEDLVAWAADRVQSTVPARRVMES